jgi:hypothetical protein
MACFIVPMVVAIVTTAYRLCRKSIQEAEAQLAELDALGRRILLAAEHVWHGEITPFFPYLTAMANPADTAVMFAEMASIGTSMAVAISLTWISVLSISRYMTNKISVTDRVSTLPKPVAAKN